MVEDFELVVGEEEKGDWCERRDPTIVSPRPEDRTLVNWAGYSF